jgi:hypothetical protein
MFYIHLSSSTLSGADTVGPSETPVPIILSLNSYASMERPRSLVALYTVLGYFGL